MTGLGKNVAITKEMIQVGAHKCAMKYSFDDSSIMRLSGKGYESYIQTYHNAPSTPTLLTMIDAFGDDMVNKWMSDNLFKVSEIAGNREKLSPVQISFASRALVSKFTGELSPQDRLNAAEVLLFFFKALSGDFGKFYGAVDAITLGTWANEFLEWRSHEIERLETEQRAELARQESMSIMKEGVPPTPEQKEILHSVIESFAGWNAPKKQADNITQETIDLHNKIFLEQLKHLEK